MPRRNHAPTSAHEHLITMPGPPRRYAAAPTAGQISRIFRHSISSACWVHLRLKDARSVVKNSFSTIEPDPATAKPIKTVPTGFLSEPPSGPAIPVVERAYPDPAR